MYLIKYCLSMCLILIWEADAEGGMFLTLDWLVLSETDWINF